MSFIVSREGSLIVSGVKFVFFLLMVPTLEHFVLNVVYVVSLKQTLSKA